MNSANSRQSRHIPLTYWIISRVLRLFVFVYFPRLKVEGAANVPRRSPAIIVSNHLDFLDPVVLLGVIPRRATFLAMSKLFDWPVIGFFTRLLGAVPVTDPPTVGLARTTLRTLAAGEAIVVFPEEELSANASLQEGSSRAATLAYRSGVPIVPVAITGTERVRWPWLFLRPLFGPKIIVRFGEPFRLAPIDRPNSAQLHAGADEIMLHVAALLPEGYRGVYAGVAAAAPLPPGVRAE